MKVIRITYEDIDERGDHRVSISHVIQREDFEALACPATRLLHTVRGLLETGDGLAEDLDVLAP